MVRLSGKRISVLVVDEFEGVELLFPLLRVSEEGASTTVATLPRSRHFQIVRRRLTDASIRAIHR
jgi:hypothetical protein